MVHTPKISPDDRGGIEARAMQKGGANEVPARRIDMDDHGHAAASDALCSCGFQGHHGAIAGLLETAAFGVCIIAPPALQNP
jgi:hypothetical protein